MRKHAKEECCGLLKLLSEAQAQVGRHIEKGQTNEARILLAQCQQGAISVGNLLEKNGEEKAQEEANGTEKAVRLLEEYCEQVYRLYESAEETGANIRKALKALDKSLLRAESCIREEIPTQTEVVFLPYKASMWDSLESVWKAADKDANCTAYVIPIPYYDKNPDDSFKEAHYEAELFPSYVPITHYNAYDFAKRHPDRIYIHNPYDEYNHVTSVHPFFYAKNLRQYTDDLVYIPYFILGEPDLKNPEALKGVENFALLPGVIQSHHTIVQSEAMREAYIRILTENIRDVGRKEWEKRILGTGSPKVDKVLSTRKEELELPEAWKRIIEKPDGTWKKIIFYNTSISALLRNNEQMLAKMRDVLRIFKENREEVALLWRPHPLLAATIESMRPQLAEAYRALTEEYKIEAWGIYDDTPDMDRAVVLSDAYYGDWSSIVWLYQKTKKPIMIQNAEILTDAAEAADAGK